MRRVVAEFIGTAAITLAVIGSAIMATIWTKDGAIWLLVNAISTVSALFISIVLFAKMSGAHFNPVVSLVEFLAKRLGIKELLSYMAAQFLGAMLGAILAHVLFDRQILTVSEIERTGMNIFASEIVASFGLVLIAIASWRKFKVTLRASLISLWIVGAYFFTASTSFANPAVSFGRMFTDSLAGISPTSLALFVPAQVIGGLLALALASYFAKESRES